MLQRGQKLKSVRACEPVPLFEECGGVAFSYASKRSGIRRTAIFRGFLHQVHFVAAATPRQQVSARFAASDNDLNFRAAVLIRAVVTFTGRKSHRKSPSCKTILPEILSVTRTLWTVGVLGVPLC
jgi:hypothetical protein